MLHRYLLKALNKLVAFLVVISFLSACSSRPNRSTGQLATSQTSQTGPGDVFDAYMASSFPVADGFDFAVGDANGQGSYIDNSTGKEYQGWYVAVQFAEQYSLGTHTGEDWNGTSETSMIKFQGVLWS